METSDEAIIRSNSWLSKAKIWLKERVHLAYNKIKELVNHAKNVAILFVHQKLFRFEIISRYISTKTNQHTKSLRQTFLIIPSFFLAYILIKFVDVPTSLSIFTSYFLTIGAMVGGVLAVVFSLTIFGQQSILDIHSAKLLRKYVYGTAEKSTFFVISLITLLFFTASHWSSGLNQFSPIIFIIFVYGSCILIALVFVLVDLLYQRVSNKSSSAEIFNFLQKESLAVLKKINKYTHRLLAVGIAEGKVKKQNISESLLKAQSRGVMYKTFQTELDEKLKVIYEITIRLINKKEYGPANTGLGALHTVIKEYLELVSDSSTSIPANSSSLGVLGLLARQSDSVDFLTTNLDRLARVGEQNVLNENVQSLQLVTNVFKALVFQAEKIVHIGNDTENQIMSMIIGYQTQYLEFAILQNNFEAVWQTAQALDDMAGSAVRANSQQSQSQIRDSIDKIILFGIKNDRSFIVNECMNAILVSIMASFGNKTPYAYTSIDDSIKQVQAKTELIFTGIKTGITTDKFVITHFFNQWLIYFPVLLNGYTRITDEDEKETYREKLIKTAEDMQKMMRNLSESIKDVDNPLVEVIGRVIDSTGEYLVSFLEDPEFAEQRSEIQKVLYGYIYLPGWFVHHATKYEKNNRNRSFVEAITKIGISLLNNYRNEKLIRACIESLFSLVQELFKKNPNSYLFDEARIMIKICYMGVLARKYNMKEIYAYVRVKILEFNNLYSNAYQTQLNQVPADLRRKIEAGEVYGFADKERLKKEFYRWRSEVYRDTSGGMSRIMGDSSGLIREMVTIEDIDWFMWEVWGEIDANSPISDKIDLKWAREKLIRTLANILSTKSLD